MIPRDVRLPDDCRELQVLRAFRDGYLSRRPGGREEIKAYYQMAPGIVRAVNERADAQSVWNDVYRELVGPCVRMIEQGRNEEAYGLYKDYSERLGERMLRPCKKQ